MISTWCSSQIPRRVPVLKECKFYLLVPFPIYSYVWLCWIGYYSFSFNWPSLSLSLCVNLCVCHACVCCAFVVHVSCMYSAFFMQLSCIYRAFVVHVQIIQENQLQIVDQEYIRVSVSYVLELTDRSPSLRGKGTKTSGKTLKQRQHGVLKSSFSTKSEGSPGVKHSESVPKSNVDDLDSGEDLTV